MIVTKFILVFISLFLLIFGIYKAMDLERPLDNYAEEYPFFCVFGGIFWVIGIVITFTQCFCDCQGFGLKLGISMIIGGMTLFIEPFIHYLFAKPKNSK